MTIPRFSECQHALVEALADCSDEDLLQQFQEQSQSSGRYFVALFCRYGSLVYSLIQHAPSAPTAAESPIESYGGAEAMGVSPDYRFAQIWKQLYSDLQNLDLSETSGMPETSTLLSSADAALAAPLTLQNWIVDYTARYIRRNEPEPGGDRYSLTYAPPPLWCYLEQSLEQLPPLHRLVVVLHRTFGWPLDEVRTYLSSKGTDMDIAAVITLLEEGFHLIDANLPEDIQAIYLSPS